MKILIVTQTFPFNSTDNTAHFMHDFANGFASLGHHVFVLTPYHPKLRPESFTKIKILTFRYIWPDFLHLLGYGRSLNSNQSLSWKNYFLFPLFFLFESIALFKIIKKEKIEVVNAHWLLPNGFISSLVSMATGVPLIITIPGSDAYLAKRNVFFKQTAMFGIRHANKVVSNSPQLLNDLAIKNGSVISYGVPINNGKRTTHGSIIIGTAGRLVEKKGIGVLKQIIPETKVLSGLSITKFRKALLGIDIFIALSIRDSKGNFDDASLTVLEAMSAGCPVITTNLPGYRKIIENGQDGYLIGVHHLSSVKRIVEKLRRSPILRKKLGQNAKKKIAKSLTPEKIAIQYINLFKQVTRSI